jgi:glutamate/tyrosine decarboxylase-like PLP-dependent enzyme
MAVENGTTSDEVAQKAMRADAATSNENEIPTGAFFLGPKAEHAKTWQDLLSYIFQDYVHWRRNYFPADPVVVSRADVRRHEEWLDSLTGQLDLILNQLKAHFPFFHPRYAAHMLSEQTLPAVLGYFAGMLYNPNNVTDEAAPVTVAYELQVGRMVAEMIGFDPARSWAHITSGGTIANIEALWVARQTQFVPLALRDFCRQRQLDFTVKTPRGDVVPLRAIGDDDVLLAFRPNESIYMPRNLVAHLHDDRDVDAAAAERLVTDALKISPYNVALRGFHAVSQLVGRNPVVFASAAAHYSVRKACNLVGYGEDALRLVPVTDRFRLDVYALHEMIEQSMRDGEYVAAVIGVVGTTEEGAVDPLHKLHFLRNDYAREANRSFWLHADAAWGGYIASLFRGHKLEETRGRSLSVIVQDYINAINPYQQVELVVDARTKHVRRAVAAWQDEDVYLSFLALKDVDSVTIDPHKLGYIPYPAGIVAFRNGVVTELIEQKANYIFPPKSGHRRAIDQLPAIDAVGPYIVEGSKPGAAASACWLAHTTLPLTAAGHGQLMRETVLNAQRLNRYLIWHGSGQLYFQFEKELSIDPYNEGDGRRAFTFVSLSPTPDTNVVCFVVRPMAIAHDKLVEVDVRLNRINEINEAIHGRMGRPVDHGGQRGSYAHPNFLSRARFDPEVYSVDSLKKPLRRLGVSDGEYESEGLFVLRATVMNPHYSPAVFHSDGTAGKDYLLEFVRNVHRVARDIV